MSSLNVRAANSMSRLEGGTADSGRAVGAVKGSLPKSMGLEGLFFTLLFVTLVLLFLSQILILALYSRNCARDGRHVTGNDVTGDLGKILSHTSQLVDDITDRSEKASLLVAANIGFAAQKHDGRNDVVMSVLDLLVSLISERLRIIGPLVDNGD
ncbi:hypothetical protein HG531_006861 [Fusarium graminearum]|nr:hypothetical protein HG531_006861 [Fusarium graminearum]